MRSIAAASHFVPCLAERFATTIDIMRIADGLSVLPWIDELVRSFRSLLVSIASTHE